MNMEAKKCQSVITCNHATFRYEHELKFKLIMISLNEISEYQRKPTLADDRWIDG